MTTNFTFFNNLNNSKIKPEEMKLRNNSLFNNKNVKNSSIFFQKTAVNKNAYEISKKNIFESQKIFADKLTATSSPINAAPSVSTGLLKKTCDIQNIAKTMIKMIDAKDEYTGQHSHAVQARAVAFAKSLGLSKHEIERIKIGSAFHDIGKIGIPETILNSSSPLTDKEFEKIKQHPDIGYKILEDIPAFSGIISKIVKHHHENWDGSGYPDKLSGENIPLAARIVAIVDSYHAMTSNRPYRKGLSIKETLKRLKEGAGKQWDPALIDKFIDTIPFLDKI